MPSNSRDSRKDSISEEDCEASDVVTTTDTGKLAIIQSMIKQMRNGTPIYRVQLPIFLQEPRSLLERYGDFCSHADLITCVSDAPNPELRFLAVVKFYLSGWHARPKELRNPFNPILGEVFKCHYEHADSTTQYIAEQISHHPPSTAFSITNEEKGVYLSAYIRPSFRFKGNSLDATLQGKLVGHSKQHKEDYEITFPHFIVKGLLFGALNLSLCGSARITCPQSGYTAEMDFRNKGMFYGKSNYITVAIKRAGHKKPVYTIDGRWDDILTITDSKGKSEVFFDAHTCPRSQMMVAPPRNQDENESRKVWQKVIQNIQNNNEPEALREKTAVEEHQRAKEREAKEKGIIWSPKNYYRISDDFYVHKSMAQLSSAFRS